MTLTLSVRPGRLAVCRLGPEEPAPSWLVGDGFSSITRTDKADRLPLARERIEAAGHRVLGS